MNYIIIIFLLFVALIIYFRIADKYNIIDKPNHRSAHTEVTLRGGGIIYPAAFLLFLLSLLASGQSLSTPQNFLVFGLGLLTICAISFVDDLRSLSSKVRLVFHFIAVTLLLYFVKAFSVLPFWSIPILYIFIIGILNAYNFMDGINGMTGVYSLVTLGSLWYVNEYVANFTLQDFILFPAIASLVFLFFNFRKKAKCFMGDIGSLGIAFWIIALLALLMMKTNDLKWILFLAVYGTETILTIMERIILKENIFDAHRRHLYQLFSNEKKIDHRIVSVSYASIQFLINMAIIFVHVSSWLISAIIITLTISLYLMVKRTIKNQIKNYI